MPTDNGRAASADPDDRAMIFERDCPRLRFALPYSIDHVMTKGGSSN